MAFSFEVIADPTVPFSLIQDANFALEQWSNVLDGKGTLVVDLNVTPTPTGRADQVLTSIPIATDDGRTVFTTSAAYELTTGQHAPNLPENSGADVIVRLDPSYVANVLYVDPNPSSTPAGASSAIPSDKTDAVSAIEHEIGHSLGILSDYPLDATSTSDLGSTETGYDRFIQFQNGGPVFIGSNAEAANNGSAIPVTDFPLSNPQSSQNFSHL